MLSGEETSIARSTQGLPAMRRALFPASIVAAGLAAHINAFAGVFLFDDRMHILGERRLRVLWPVWEALGRRRPVVDYSLALNYEIGGEKLWGYHAVNLAIHFLAGLTLFGIVRRTLLRESSRSGCADHCGSDSAGRAAPWLALVVAMIWIVHPLQTQSVTYLIQRAESLMGLFYLLTLYCVIRGAVSPRPAWWHVGAVISCGLGMGSKAVMVTAPAVVLLYDRVFLSKSFSEAFRRRWLLYAALTATWGVLLACGVVGGVLSSSSRGAHVGFSFKGITPLQYALTQPGVLLHYLKLSLWPAPLCFDYNWPVARTTATILPPLLAITAALGWTIWALSHKPSLGFVGAFFLAVLGPTSSVIPIKDTAFEQRMYLSSAAVIVLMVIGTHRILCRLTTRTSLSASLRRSIGVLAVVCPVVSLAYATNRRNLDYHNEVGMWRDTLAKRPYSPRAAENLGTALLGTGRMEEAMTALEYAVRVSPRSSTAHNALGLAFVARGRLEEATASFREALRLQPFFPRAHLNLGNALTEANRTDEAIEHFRTALRYRPDYSEARLNLGNTLLTQGEIDEAIEQYREILRSDPLNASAWGNLGTALLNKSRTDGDALGQAIDAFHRALEIDPAAHNVHNSLGIALVSQGKVNDAIEAFRQALQHKRDFAGAHYNLANCLVEKGDLGGAVGQYRVALELNPSDASTHFELGQALTELGDRDAAIEEFRETLRLRPDHAGARRALEAALARRGGSPSD